jgi:peptidylprolyl isomerase
VRRNRLLLAAFVLPFVLVTAAACGGGSGGGSGKLPTVTGSYGDKPTLTFSGKPSKTLQKQVLKEGTGTAIAKGDLIVVDYLGQIFKGKLLDNTYDRKQPLGAPIGSGKVFPGWDEALVGVKVGSRVLLVLPPDKGYGAQGNSQAGISGTDTLVFVIDVIDVYGPTAAGDPKAVKQTTSTGGVKVGGALAKRPTVSVTKGTAVPKKAVTVLLAKGTGAVVKAGFVVLHYEAVDWTNKALASTWKLGAPAGIAVGQASTPNPFDSLVGMPVGSRVLVEIPPQPGSKPTDSAAVVIDIVAEPPTAKEAAAG